MLLLFWCCFLFFDKNTFCLLTNGFQLFLKFLCVSPTSFSYFFLLWGQFDVYWYILEAGGLLSFHANFYSGGGGQMSGGVLHSHSRGGVDRGVLSPFSHPFSHFSHPSSPFSHPLFPFSFPCSSPFSHPLSPFSHPFSPFSHLPSLFSHPPSKLLPQPCPPLHSFTGLFAQKPLPPGTIRTNGKKVE